MNLPQLALANLRAQPMTSLLNIGLLALGTATITFLLLLSHQFSQALSRDARGIDLVLGAKGSPVQLVLSSVYHADIPTGNIPLAEARQWARDRRVARAIPLALGDSAQGARIVGTTQQYPELYGAKLKTGQWWDQPLEAVLGSEVAKRGGFAVGQTFVGAHGIGGHGEQHGQTPYRVTGVLEPTGSVIDQLILTSLESVWAVHGEEHSHDHHHNHHHDRNDHDEQAPVEAQQESEQQTKSDLADDAHQHESAHDHAETHEAHANEQDHDEHHDHDGHHDHDKHDDHEKAEDRHEDHDHDADAHLDHQESRADGHEDSHEHEESGHDEAEQAPASTLKEWDSDDHLDRDITALLIQYASPISAVSMPMQINSQSNLQAAAPAFELARLLKLVGVGLDGLRAFAVILIASAAFSIFGALYAALRGRRGELAIMRCMGATRLELMLCLLAEGMILGIAGIVFGLIIGHSTAEILGHALAANWNMSLTGATLLWDELLLAGGLLIVVMIAAALPAWQAYRTDVAQALSEVA